VPYLGFGIGAASYLNNTRWSNIRDFRRYLSLDFEAEAANRYPNLHEQVQALSRNAQMEEFMFLGLRRTAGISALEFKQKFQVEIDSVYGPVLDRFTREGLLLHEGFRYRFSPHGMDVSNQILSEFLLD
jgi:oxygen-independent coproporphyrinogen-3 oxidase